MTDGASLHRCGRPLQPVRRGTQVPRLPFRTIDVHCHAFTPSVENLVAGHPGKIAEVAAGREALGEEAFRINAALSQQLLPQLTDFDSRIRDMDAMGVDIQAISPSPIQCYYWAEPDLAQTIVSRQNDQVAAICGARPDRFVPLGTVCLQYPIHAAKQLQVLMRERNFKGVQISTLVNGRDIAEGAFDPFWQMAEDLGAVVLIHPWGSTLGSRLAQHYLMNSIGQPFEHTVCLSKLIFGGTFDRHPRLKIIAAHGGGYLPAYVHRADHAHAVRPDAGWCQCRPSEYLRRIWFDSIVYETDSLRRLIDVVGREQVVIGTDYPYDMGHYDPSGLVRPLADETQRMILGSNAAALFGLSEA